MKSQIIFIVLCAIIVVLIGWVFGQQVTPSSKPTTCETLLQQRNDIRYADMSDQRALIESNERLFVKCGCDTIDNLK